MIKDLIRNLKRMFSSISCRTYDGSNLSLIYDLFKSQKRNLWIASNQIHFHENNLISYVFNHHENKGNSFGYFVNGEIKYKTKWMNIKDYCHSTRRYITDEYHYKIIYYYQNGQVRYKQNHLKNEEVFFNESGDLIDGIKSIRVY